MTFFDTTRKHRLMKPLDIKRSSKSSHYFLGLLAGETLNAALETRVTMILQLKPGVTNQQEIALILPKLSRYIELKKKIVK